jgi:hypothetical protein
MKRIRIDSRYHRGGSLIVAFSDDLKGLLVYGRTPEEIEARLPEAIREILVAQGMEVGTIEVGREDESLPEDFIPAAFVANAAITYHKT